MVGQTTTLEPAAGAAEKQHLGKSEWCGGVLTESQLPELEAELCIYVSRCFDKNTRHA